MNLVIVTGRVATDPAMHTSKRGRMFCRYRFAVEGDYISDGTKEVDFTTVLAYGKQAQYQKGVLRKGMRVLIRGKMKTYMGKDKFGSEVEKTCIVCKQMEFIDARFERDPIKDLRGNDGEMLIPREVLEGINKIVDKTDEDMPAEFMERSTDDLLQIPR